MDQDVILAMVMCSIFLQDVPLGFREKVILCVLILKYMNLYIQTEADLIWVNKKLDEMSRDQPSVARESENQFLEPSSELV